MSTGDVSVCLTLRTQYSTGRHTAGTEVLREVAQNLKGQYGNIVKSQALESVRPGFTFWPTVYTIWDVNLFLT